MHHSVANRFVFCGCGQVVMGGGGNDAIGYRWSRQKKIRVG